MLEEQVQTTTESQNQEQAAIDLSQYEAFAFQQEGGTPVPPATAEATAQTTEGGAAENQTQNEGQAAAVTENDTIDDTAYLSQHFGFATLEEAKAAFEELKTLKNTPPKTAEEIAFANEDSKRIFNALKEGKHKEVFQFLQAQDMLSNLENMGDEQRLKLYIKMQNPLFDQELIEDEYNSLYKPVEDEFDDDPIKLRKEKLRTQQRVSNDVQKANEYFAQYKTKIELPDIQKQAAQATVDQDYEDYKASIAKNLETYNTNIRPAIAALKEQDVAFNVAVNDANNQMQFDVSIAPDKNDFDAAKNMALDYEAYMQSSFYDEKGNFMANKLQRAILLEKNFDKYAQSIARQAVNAERKRVIEKESAGGAAIQRDFTVQEEPEYKKHEKYVFAGI